MDGQSSVLGSNGAALERSWPNLGSHGILASPNYAMDAVDPLIQRAQDGDERAFREIFLRHRGDVSRLVHRMLGHSPDVDDVVQDVFVHVYRSLKSFRGESKFSTWLYRLTTNVTRMHLRKGRSRPRIAQVEVPEAPRDSRPGDTPERAAERNQRLAAFHRVLAGLSEKKRAVLVMHDLEGLSAKRISEIVEAPVLTVRTRLFYARKELLAAFADEPTLAGLAKTLAEEGAAKAVVEGLGTESATTTEAVTDAEPGAVDGLARASEPQAKRPSSPELER